MVHLVTADETAAACPPCGALASRVKEYVGTHPRDLPCGGDGLRLAKLRAALDAEIAGTVTPAVQDEEVVAA